MPGMPNSMTNLQTDISLVPTLLLVTHTGFEPMTVDGLAFARAFVRAWREQRADAVDLTVFLYGDGASLANRLTWLSADMPNTAKDWQDFAKTSGVLHQVCVSTALARGVVDADNAKRHGLDGENLADGFQLVGLGELAMHLHRCQQVKQF